MRLQQEMREERQAMMERFREIHEAAYSNYPTSFLAVRFFKHELAHFKTRIQEMLSNTDRKESSKNIIYMMR